jgi:acyl-CoA synthetase (AMP-forming)/AMP-acid ligase II
MSLSTLANALPHCLKTNGTAVTLALDIDYKRGDLILIESRNINALTIFCRAIQLELTPVLMSECQLIQFVKANATISRLIAGNRVLLIPSPAEIPPLGPCIGIPSSGSTKGCKIAIVTENALIERLMRMMAIYGKLVGFNFVSALPVSSSFAFHHLMLSAYAGGYFNYWRLTGRSPTGGEIATQTANLVTTPAICRIILGSIRLRTSLTANVERVLLGGEMAGTSLYQRLASSGIRSIFDTYGSCEAGFLGIKNIGLAETAFKVYAPEEMRRDARTGDLSINSPALFDGYLLRDPDGQAFYSKRATGGYPLNDIGYLKEGELLLTGRRENLIRLGSQIASITDIEESLQRHYPEYLFHGHVGERNGTLVIEYQGPNAIRVSTVRRLLRIQGLTPSASVTLKQVEHVKLTEGKINRSISHRTTI